MRARESEEASALPHPRTALDCRSWLRGTQPSSAMIGMRALQRWSALKHLAAQRCSARGPAALLWAAPSCAHARAAHVAVAEPAKGRVGVRAAAKPPSAAEANAGPPAADAQLAALGIKLPTCCCGCGVQLQRVDADAAG